ncbi:tetratricopeptide repeat protein [Ktedonobacter racemifer]|uniref:TPR repeat-containing protein n=1 Tax=Ktedonobacter racemifer DSM 44963 TaxID=485913 RepID=D6TDL4_KTERA|nr:tetratricopeptide repeat protein [Ktedonobacter racemifer]EFH88359.1 TPR repeat-containing protein [Ktedonobacter racemifer DSM 44963]
MSRRLGLIAGINTFQDPAFRPLRYAENDARALAQWLVNNQGGKWSPGDVQLIQGQHVTHELFKSLVSQMCTQLAAPGDQVLLYFAGQAFVDERTGDGYLALANTQMQNTQTALHLGTLIRQILPQCRASQLVFVFDCYQTGQLWSMRRTSPFDFTPLLGRTLSGSLQPTKHLLTFSCRGNEFGEERGEQGLGIFAHRMIAGLCGPARDPQSGNITFQQLQSVLAQNLDEQHKIIAIGQLQAPFLLAGEPAPQPIEPVHTAAGSSPAHQPLHTTTGNFGNATATQVAPPPGPPQQLNANAQKEQQIAQLVAQAKQQLQQNNQPYALQLLEQALQVQPTNVEALTLKSQLLGSLGRTREAFTTVDQLIQVDANNALGWSMRAVLLNNSGQYQAALVAIERSLELNPNNPETYGIKTNIMASLASAQSSNGKSPMTPLSKETATTSLPGRFLGSLTLQFLGTLLAIGGLALLVVPKLPAPLGLLIASIGLGLLCVHAFLGAFRHGLKSVFTTLLFSLVGFAIVGGAYKFGETRLISLFKTHPSLLEPTIFFAIALPILSTLALFLAIIGYIAGLINRLRKRG